MPGPYDIVRFGFIGIGVLLLGMVLGGGAHLAASIVSHAGKVVFDFPVFSAGVGVGLVAGLLIGGDWALTRLGEFEKGQRWERIKK